MALFDDFIADDQGKRFADVVRDRRISFQEICSFLERDDIKRRLEESERHHDRPPLAGVIRELEHRADVNAFFIGNDAHTTERFRKAVGVAVKIIMKGKGWSTTGKKGSLGVRKKVPTRTTTPGAYHNIGGISLWFSRSERYTTEIEPCYRPVEERAAEVEALIANRDL